MNKMIILFMIIFLLCGCTNQKCVKSHEEKGRCVWFSTTRVGNITNTIPHYYSCTKTVCDEYEEVSE